MSAGLKMLYPSPPKNCFVMTTAMIEPIIGTWIVNGLNDHSDEGRFMPSSNPVRNALPSLTVSFFLTAFWKKYSERTDDIMHKAVIKSAFKPKK